MTDIELPTIRVATIADALAPSALRDIPGDALVRYLRTRRWFGAKSSAPSDARIADVLALPLADPPACIALVEVHLAGGRQARYQLPLVVCEGEMSEENAPSSTLALVDAGGIQAIVFDGSEDARVRAWLARTIADGASTGGPELRLQADVVDGTEMAAAAALRSRVGTSEQSNTSIVFGDRAILKLFRRLEHGENPELEMAAALARAGFRNTPSLLGSLRILDSEGSQAAAIAQRFLPDSRDAWSYALERGRADFTARNGESAAVRFAADAQALGAVTRAMHDALASNASHPDFSAVSVTPADVQRWVESTRRGAQEALALLGRMSDEGRLNRERAGEGKVLATRRDAYLAHIDELVLALHGDAGARIRHHGDYHLGQVLRTAQGDWMITDFEGEPARPLAERRERHSALRDVAGMLRSIAYAAAMLTREQQGVIPPQVLEPRSARWERAVREAYVNGYFGGTPTASYLPASRVHSEALLALFETEKVFYELSYELNNRPEWSWIPLRGIARLLFRKPAG